MIDLKLLRIITGEEIIADVVNFSNGLVTVKNALVVLPQGQQFGFMQWASVIDPEQPEITLDMKHVVYMAEVHPRIQEKYNSMFGSDLTLPEEKKLIL